MAKNSKQVRVALTGSVFYLPTPITALTGLTLDAAPAGAVDLGWTTPDGVTFTLGREVQGIDAWQTPNLLRQLVLSEPKSMSYTLRQLARQQWLAAMGGTISQVSAAVPDNPATTEVNEAEPAVYRWVPKSGQIVEGTILVDFEDGDIAYRFGFPYAQQTAEVEFSLVRNDAINLPNTWTALEPEAAGVPVMFVDTNDPAFAA